MSERLRQVVTAVNDGAIAAQDAFHKLKVIKIKSYTHETASLKNALTVPTQTCIIRLGPVVIKAYSADLARTA